jgi:23S rRNA pseudouridine2457 synthase
VDGTGQRRLENAMSRILLLNKPYGVLSQFTDARSPSPRPTLSGFVTVPGVYPAGRLDRDSEGLLVLTDDGALQARIADPRHKLPKTYLVQVEGAPSDADLAPLRHGVTLNDGPTRPAQVQLIAPPALWERDPPVRFRKAVPDQWIEITIHRAYRFSDVAAGALADRGLDIGRAGAGWLAGCRAAVM